MASAEARKKAARTRATARAQARTRQTMRTPGRMVEQGVGWGNIARGVARIVGGSRGAAKPAASTAKKTTAARTPGRRTAKTPQWATSYGTKKPSQVTIKVNKRDVAQTKRLQEYVASKPKAKPKMSKKKKAAIGGAVVGGVGTLAYATKPKSMGSEGPKRRSPVSPVVGGKKRKNVVQQKGGTIRFRG